MPLTETHPAVRPPAPARPLEIGRQPLSFGLNRPLIAWIVTALLGLLATVAPWIAGTQTDLESAAGLRILYGLRGVREPPREVVIVLIDQTTLDEPDFPDDLGEWSRVLHAKLLRRLEASRPGVVGFDFHFNKARDVRGDREFAQAIKDNGNVVLIEFLIPARSRALLPGSIELTERRSWPPIPPLADAAAMVVPFLLPDGLDLDQLLLRDPAGNNLPTFPLAALLVYSKPYLDTLAALVREVSGQPVEVSRLVTLAEQLYTRFARDPKLADELIDELTSRADFDQEARAALMALIGAVRTLDPRHIDYYGPPGTVTTIPYQCILQGGCDAFPAGRFSSLHRKAVFVGFSDLRHGSVKDRFPTVYGNFSGVEIGATAFANLLERRSLRPLAVLWHLCIVVMWAALLAPLATKASTGFAMCGILALSTAYGSAAYLAFAHSGLWLPLAVPIAIQTPLAAAIALLRGYLEERRERARNEHELARLEDGLRVHLPRQVVESIARNTPEILSSGQIMYGVCIHSDAGQFTLLSETMKAVPLRALLNGYYEPLFDAVKKHEGWVSDVIGDAMLAMWPTAAPEPKAKRAACDAALEIIRAVGEANPHCLPTRVGIHCGELVLGNVGARGRFEYRAVGEVVNKTERIERANKRLGTRILASYDVTSGIEGLLTREIGSFYLPGTNRPVVLCEILDPEISTLGSSEHKHRYFNAALTAFKLQDFDQAQQIFETLLKDFGDDGPARFYLDLCRQFETVPPEPPWTGCVRL
ncbi:MAG: CHASE2 domain-containing protein [Gammaproteobacteria bacterium]